MIEAIHVYFFKIVVMKNSSDAEKTENNLFCYV